jgi:hypothetical protein
MKEKEELTKDISQVGLWTSEVEVDNGLEVIKGINRKKGALKLQIKFRKKVLSQNYHDKTVFQFSHQGRPYSVPELKQNLLKLLHINDFSHNSLSDAEICNDPEILLYRRIEHQFNCDGTLIWFKGTVIGFDKETNISCHF